MKTLIVALVSTYLFGCASGDITFHGPVDTSVSVPIDGSEVKNTNTSFGDDKDKKPTVKNCLYLSCREEGSVGIKLN